MAFNQVNMVIHQGAICEVLFLSSVLHWCILCLCRKENEALVYNLQMEMNLLKADLQASQLQEEESVSQKGQLASLEKNRRYDLQ